LKKQKKKKKEKQKKQKKRKKKMAMETTKDELVMAPTYNDYSQLQNFGLLTGINDYFQQFIKEFAAQELNDKLVLADYGCSGGGKNSMVMIQKIYEFLKDSSQKDFLLQSFLIGSPDNDYNAVLRAYQESLLAKEKNIFLSCTVGSFYDQILPPNSLDLACSFSALDWLSETEGLGSFSDPNCFYFSLADPAKDHDKIHYLLNIATKDVQNFLLARKKELVSGGLLLFSCLGSESLIPTQEERRRKDAIAHHQFQMRDVPGMRMDCHC
jgi:gibberellin A4 carboxyl methyltransferase